MVNWTNKISPNAPIFGNCPLRKKLKALKILPENIMARELF
jgi:hypothetical protein